MSRFNIRKGEQPVLLLSHIPHRVMERGALEHKKRHGHNMTLSFYIALGFFAWNSFVIIHVNFILGQIAEIRVVSFTVKIRSNAATYRMGSTA